MVQNIKKLIHEISQFSTPLISDALDACGINGYLSNILPLGKSQKLIGPAFTVQYTPINQNPTQYMQAGNYIDDVPPGYIIVIDNGGIQNCSVWGGILTHYAFHKKILGTVIYGMARDKQTFDQYEYPIYALGITARTGKNRVRLKAKQCNLVIEGVSINFNDIVFADCNGTIVIPKEHLEQILQMTQNIAANENRILQAIDAGISLKEARIKFNYDKPWKDSE